MRRKIDPRQLSLFTMKAPIHSERRLIKPTPNDDPEMRFQSWLDEPAPMIAIAGKNPHIVQARTFRSFDADVWLSRSFVETGLSKSRFYRKGTLKTDGVVWDVYRPRRKK